MVIRRALQTYRRVGPVETGRRAVHHLVRVGAFHAKSLRWRLSGAPEYQPPSAEELQLIEAEFLAGGIDVVPLHVDVEEFGEFVAALEFPATYYSDATEAVRIEKLLEHYLASSLLGLASFPEGRIYVDVAACNSPWAQILRESRGVEAFAIDLNLGSDFSMLPYYQEQDATATSFADSSISGASLQCAFEMFEGDDDVKLITELARVLAPRGKAVILPLYMHTRYCAYASPEHFGRGKAPPGAIEFIRYDIRGVPSSRKYDVATLRTRVLDECHRVGLKYTLHAIRNRNELPEGTYCHFILELRK